VEKVLYVVTPRDGASDVELGQRLLGEVAPALVAGGAIGVQVNVVDAAVAPAVRHRIASSSAPAEGLVSVWLDSAVDHLRRWADVAIAPHVGMMAAYLVTESVPLPNTRHPAREGQRTAGFAQIAFLRRPDDQTQEAWLHRWLDEHTPTAIGTQDTFAYVQNVVARRLTADAPPWDGIVEECFPAAAMTDQHAFFDAVGDDERLRQNQLSMFQSCARFLDVTAIDVLPTSRHVVLAARA
jgi:hypothetical protein